MGLRKFFCILFSNDCLSTRAGRGLSVRDVSRGNEGPIGGVSTDTAMLLALGMRMRSPCGEVAVSCGHGNRETFTIFLLSVFIKGYHETISSVQYHSPPLRLSFLRFGGSSKECL